MDPDGRIFFNKFEAQFVKEVLGNKGLYIYYTTAYFPLSKDGRSGSFPFVYGIIFYDKATYINPMRKNGNTFIHEIFHQIQYLTTPVAFLNLISEYSINEQMATLGAKISTETIEVVSNSNMVYYYNVCEYDGNLIVDYTYEYSQDNLSQYKTLNDLPYYEAQAQFVGDFAELYYLARYKNGLSEHRTEILKQMATIMKNSGYGKTEAVRWILEN